LGVHAGGCGTASCAEDGSRTHTGLTAHRILSPERLPVPPPRLANVKLEIVELEIEKLKNLAAEKGKEVSEGRQF
jgi:hypothetical protein